MIEDALFLIPARGGSKGIPGKNIKELCGHPLIGYSIDAARQLVPDEQICVSTDSEEIKGVVESLGLKVPFLRPDELASDTAGSIGVMRHALDWYKSLGKEYKYLVLLQPTSPLRTAEHLKEAIADLKSDTQLLVSVKLTDANPYYLLYEENEQGNLQPFVQGKTFDRRQDIPDVYEINGAIYIFEAESLYKFDSLKSYERVQKYVMSRADSVDIDHPEDWLFCEALLSMKKEAI